MDAKLMTTDALTMAKALFGKIEALRPDRELEMKVEVVDGDFSTWTQFYSALLNWAEQTPALLAHIEALQALALRPVQYRNGVNGRDGLDIEPGETVFVLDDAGQLIAARCHGSLWGEPDDREAWRVRYCPLSESYVGVVRRAPFQRCYRVPLMTASPTNADLRRERDQDHA